jgi:hypothetical protein
VVPSTGKLVHVTELNLCLKFCLQFSLLTCICVCFQSMWAHVQGRFLYFSLFRKNFTFRPLKDLIPFLDPLLGAIACGAEVTHLDATGCGAEVPVALASGADVAPSSAPQILAPSQDIGGNPPSLCSLDHARRRRALRARPTPAPPSPPAAPAAPTPAAPSVPHAPTPAAPADPPHARRRPSLPRPRSPPLSAGPARPRCLRSLVASPSPAGVPPPRHCLPRP